MNLASLRRLLLGCCQLRGWPTAALTVFSAVILKLVTISGLCFRTFRYWRFLFSLVVLAGGRKPPWGRWLLHGLYFLMGPTDGRPKAASMRLHSLFQVTTRRKRAYRFTNLSYPCWIHSCHIFVTLCSIWFFLRCYFMTRLWRALFLVYLHSHIIYTYIYIYIGARI